MSLPIGSTCMPCIHWDYVCDTTLSLSLNYVSELAILDLRAAGCWPSQHSRGCVFEQSATTINTEENGGSGEAIICTFCKVHFEMDCRLSIFDFSLNAETRTPTKSTWELLTR